MKHTVSFNKETMDLQAMEERGSVKEALKTEVAHA
jgi:hypothetical protein